MALRRILGSRVVLGLGTALALAVPAMTLPRLPHVSPWPLLIAMPGGTAACRIEPPKGS